MQSYELKKHKQRLKNLREGLYFKYEAAQKSCTFRKGRKGGKKVENSSLSMNEYRNGLLKMKDKSIRLGQSINCGQYNPIEKEACISDDEEVPSVEDIELALITCNDQIQQVSQNNSYDSSDVKFEEHDFHAGIPICISNNNVKTNEMFPNSYVYPKNITRCTDEPTDQDNLWMLNLNNVLVDLSDIPKSSNECQLSQSSKLQSPEFHNSESSLKNEASKSVKKFPDPAVIKQYVLGKEICDRKLAKHNERVKQRVRKRMSSFLQALESQSKMSMMILNAAHKTNEMRPLFPSNLNRWSSGSTLPSQSNDPIVLIRLFTWLLGMEHILEELEERDEKHLQEKIRSQLTADDELAAINMMTNHFSNDDNVSLKATLGVLTNDNLFEEYVNRRTFLERRDSLILSIKNLKMSVKRQLEDIVESLPDN